MASQTAAKKEESGLPIATMKSEAELMGFPKSEEPAPKVEHFAVRVDPSHPAGHYQRGGVQFSSTTDVFFDVVPEIIARDPWLMITKVEVGKAPAYSSQERRAKQAGRRL